MTDTSVTSAPAAPTGAPVPEPLVRHRPRGIEHPYATSADQRVPVLPDAGDRVRLGVIVDPAVTAVACEWQDVTAGAGELVRLPLAPVVPDAADAMHKLALAGGEGHLAEAQASQLQADGAWAVLSPPVEGGRRYRYRFVAQAGPAGGAGDAGLDTEAGPGAGVTEWFDLSAGVWSETGGELLVGGAGVEAGHPRLVPGSVRWLHDATGVQRVRFALRLDPAEHVVGFGERFDAVDQRGRRLDAVVFEQYKSQGEHGRTYLPMPFAHVVGGEGWGFHVRTARRTWYDVGATTPDELVVEAALGGASVERLEVAVYDGDPASVVQAFTAEVGRASELPDWVLRLWASGNEWNTQEIVMARMDAHRDLAIPVGVVVIEAWSDEEGITIWRDARYDVHPDGAPHRAEDFSYPADGAWPDPAGMIRELHDRGITVVLWQIPLLKTAFDLGPDVPPEAQVLADGRAMVAAGHAVREADGSAYHNRGWWFPQSLMADLSTPEGRAWWTERRRYLVEGMDVDGFKTDGGEHAWGADLRYGDGSLGDEGNNRYPVHYARAFGDLLRSCGKAPVTFSRAGFTGSQAHGIVWAGDENSTWSAFAHSVTAGLTAAACGIVYWGWDLAGFSGPVPDAELYVRATAAATFMPVMQYHSEFHHHQLPLRDRTPWHVAETNGEPSVVEVFRRYAVLRERLVPYLAEQARVAIETGRPLMRTLGLAHPHDPQAWQRAGEYLLGDHLLVHPVTEPGVEAWPTYLPEGLWVDVWTGATVAGGRVIDAPAPRDVVPVWCRAEAWPTLGPVFRT